MIGFWLGGAIATGVLLGTQAMADRTAISPWMILAIAVWPVTLSLFAWDIANGWQE